jgi:hypothetical protein
MYSIAIYNKIGNVPLKFNIKNDCLHIFAK